MTANVAAQPDWFFVALTSSGDVIAIDKNFTRSATGVTRVWQKTVMLNDTYTISLWEWRCAKKSFRTIQTALYDGDGIIERDDERTPWRYFVPDSTGMLLYLNICGEGDRKGSPSNGKNGDATSPLFAQIIVKQADLMSEADGKSETVRRVRLNEKLTLLSRESVGVWYRVADPKTNSQGWLHGNNFRIVEAKKAPASGKKKTRRR